MSDDEKRRASVLDSLAWLAMPHKAMVSKLASMLLKDPDAISSPRRRARYRSAAGEPPVLKVTAWIKQYFTPPHGQGAALSNLVISEFVRQKAIKTTRASNPPYKWSAPSKSQRLETLAELRYSIIGYDGVKKDVSCKAASRIGPLFVMVDSGNYSNSPRIYFRHNESGIERVAVLKGDLRNPSITAALTHILPKRYRRTMFAGARVNLLIDPLAFDVDGEMIEAVNVIRVYDDPHKSEARPT